MEGKYSNVQRGERVCKGPSDQRRDSDASQANCECVDASQVSIRPQPCEKEESEIRGSGSKLHVVSLTERYSAYRARQIESGQKQGARRGREAQRCRI